MINQHVFLRNIVLIQKLNVFLYFHSQKTNADGILSLDFVNVSNFDWKLYFFKINSIGENLCQLLQFFLDDDSCDIFNFTLNNNCYCF